MKWIFPCNSNDYDIEGAFDGLKSIDWTVRNYKVAEGDTIYIYVSAPVKAIRYKYIVTKTDKKYTTIDDVKYGGAPAGTSGETYAELKGVFKFAEPGITLDEMRDCGYMGSMQGPVKVSEEIGQLISYRETGALPKYETDTEENCEDEITVNRNSLVRYMDAFRAYLTEEGSSLTPLRWNKNYAAQEGYKYQIAETAASRLFSGAWNKSDIGQGEIYCCVKDALDSCGNLVNFNQKNHFINCCNNDMKTAEAALYSLYCGNDEEKAFENVIHIFGRRYDLIAFLFFIYDNARYLPISPGNFEKKFKKIGIDYQMSGKCSWENYRTFIRIIETIKDYMNEYLEVGANLLDAHSFIWMLDLLDNYLADDHPIKPLPKDVEAIIRRRIGQTEYKKKLMEYWDNSCSVTGCKETSVLIASHIKPWAMCEKNNEWVDKYNGLLLTPNLDKCFDLGLISFTDAGNIIVSSKLNKKALQKLAISSDMKLRKIHGKHKEYLTFHRENIFKK